MYGAFVDHHVHSHFSWDCESSLDDLVTATRGLGLAGLVVTDHVEFERADPGYGTYCYEEAREAWEEVQDLTPDLRIRFGAEVTHQVKALGEIRQFLHGHRFHWVIGAAHYVGSEEVGALVPRLESEGVPLEDGLEGYFDACLSAVECNLYDCLAHLDFPKRYAQRRQGYDGDFWMRHYGRAIRRILTACLDMGVFLEVNTGAYRLGFSEPYPGWAILDAYADLGGREVVLSSDAHRPEDVGTAYGAVVKELVRRGISVRNGVT